MPGPGRRITDLVPGHEPEPITPDTARVHSVRVESMAEGSEVETGPEEPIGCHPLTARLVYANVTRTSVVYTNLSTHRGNHLRVRLVEYCRRQLAGHSTSPRPGPRTVTETR
jgi:hypothetical protein